MDETWLAVLGTRQYLFPNDWPWVTWGTNLGYAVTIGVMYWYRRSAVGVSVQETGLMVGCGVLLLVFILSVPFVVAGVALAVQLQVSRVFWLLDFFWTTYFVWLLIESPPRSRWGLSSVHVRYAGLALFAVGAIVRGGYVMWVEFPDRALIELKPAASDWQRVMEWGSHTTRGRISLLIQDTRGDMDQVFAPRPSETPIWRTRTEAWPSTRGPSRTAWVSAFEIWGTSGR